MYRIVVKSSATRVVKQLSSSICSLAVSKNVNFFISSIFSHYLHLLLVCLYMYASLSVTVSLLSVSFCLSMFFWAVAQIGDKVLWKRFSVHQSILPSVCPLPPEGPRARQVSLSQQAGLRAGQPAWPHSQPAWPHSQPARPQSKPARPQSKPARPQSQPARPQT